MVYARERTKSRGAAPFPFTMKSDRFDAADDEVYVGPAPYDKQQAPKHYKMKKQNLYNLFDDVCER